MHRNCAIIQHQQLLILLLSPLPPTSTPSTDTTAAVAAATATTITTIITAPSAAVTTTADISTTATTVELLVKDYPNSQTLKGFCFFCFFLGGGGVGGCIYMEIAIDEFIRNTALKQEASFKRMEYHLKFHCSSSNNSINKTTIIW